MLERQGLESHVAALGDDRLHHHVDSFSAAVGCQFRCDDTLKPIKMRRRYAEMML
jgi:hypothetical protein